MAGVALAVLPAVLLAGLVGAAGATAPRDGIDPGERVWRALVRGDTTTARTLLARVIDGTDTSPRIWAVAGLLGIDHPPPRGPASDLATATSELARGGTEAALPRLRRCVATAESTGDSVLALTARQLLGAVLLDRHEGAAAIKQLRAAVALAAHDSTRFPVTLCRSRLDLGRALVRARDLDGATPLLTLARDAAIRDTLDDWAGDAALALSVVARLRGDLDGALARRQEALAAYTRAGDLVGMARSQHYVATIHAMRGELSHALAGLARADSLARLGGDRNVLSGCLGDLAGLDFLVGDFTQALATYREALQLTDDPRRRGWYLVNSGSILVSLHRYDEAMAAYRSADSLLAEHGDPAARVTVRQAIGQCLCELHRTEEGLRELAAAAALARRHGLERELAGILNIQGYALLDLGRLDAAADTLARAAALADRTGWFDLLASVRVGRARVARRRGDLEGAIAALEEAAAIVRDVRLRSGGMPDVQAGLVAEAGRVYDELIDVLVAAHARFPDAGYDRRAFAVAQAARARSLSDLLAEADIELRPRADERYRAREKEILDELAALDARRAAAPPDSLATLDAAEAELTAALAALATRLRTADPRYAELRYPDPPSLATVRREILQPGELLLQYQLGRDASHLFAVARDTFLVATLPARDSVATVVQELLPLLRDYNLTGPDPTWFLPSARRTAALLLEPVLALLPRHRRLLVVPDGILHHLPLAVLPTGPATGTRYADLPLLVRDHEVTVIPSAAALARLRHLPPAPADALLLAGDPPPPRDRDLGPFARAAGLPQLGPVPGAGAELQELAARWRSGPVTLLAGPDATETAVRTALTAHPWHTVHLACHGLLNEHRPRYSGLVLAAAGDDDGFLSLPELFGLEIQACRVVLSACSTALGRHVRGEGLVGLVRALLYAGARSVTASLWDVPGEGARRFMIACYDDPAADHDWARAVADAQRRLLDSVPDPGGVDWSHPVFWAGFVVVGEDRLCHQD